MAHIISKMQYFGSSILCRYHPETRIPQPKAVREADALAGVRAQREQEQKLMR